MSMSHPLVSIVIPCHNAERYVGDAIRSAIGQTYPNVEVIVVDDGSTDGSLDVIRSFGAAVRWQTGANSGGCAARNRGIGLARGELIQFLDADDWLDTDKLARQVEVILRREADLVFCNARIVSADTGETIRELARRYSGEDPVVWMLRGTLQTAAPIHWKHHLDRVGGFRVGLPCSQERDLHLRLACAGLTFQHVPEKLYTVRRVQKSVSSNSERVLDQHRDLVWHAHGILRASGLLTPARAAAFAALLAHDARWYLRLKAPEKAWRYFADALLLHPSGGLDDAYGRITRILRRVFGAKFTERLIVAQRALRAGRISG
jgi:glycosyltransferase involved in cell wall biosynthesis